MNWSSDIGQWEGHYTVTLILTNQILNYLKRPEFPPPTICDFTLKHNSLMSMIYFYYNVDIIKVA